MLLKKIAKQLLFISRMPKLYAILWQAKRDKSVEKEKSIREQKSLGEIEIM